MRGYRFLLVLLFLTQLCNSLSFHSGGLSRHYGHVLNGDEATGVLGPRNYRLYNYCSRGYLAFIGRDVKAHPGTHNNLSNLRVSSAGRKSEITIQNEQTSKYLCFNKNGKLTVRSVGRSDRCKFYEISAENHYFEYQSVHNPGWYIGFRRDGRPLPGARYTERRNRPDACYQFMRITQEPAYESRFGQHPNWLDDVHRRGRT